MHDMQEIRAHPEEVRQALSRRGIEPPIETLLALDSDRRALLTQVEQLKAETEPRLQGDRPDEGRRRS